MGCTSKEITNSEKGDIYTKSISSPIYFQNKNNNSKNNDVVPNDISGFYDDNGEDSDKEIFKKIKIISKNHFSKIYLIRSKETMQEYVYKIINISNSNDEPIKKVLHDIDILKSLDHPNIISLKNAYFSEDKKDLYVFTEYADDGDLQMKLNQNIKNNENFEEETLLNWLMQISLALNYIHSNNIIHRNVKPSNIFLMKDNFAKLGDFGVAKTLSPTLRYAKTIVATPKYLAPEIIKKEGYTYMADIWSLGVTFFQLMHLQYPFEGKTDEEIENNILNGNIKKLPNNNSYDVKFIELINEMLSVRPDARPSAKEILEKTIIKTRIESYLSENNFDALVAKKTIKEYEDEIIKQNENKKKEIFVANDDDDTIKDFISPEKLKINEDKRKKKSYYDISRQMTLMKNDFRKSKTFNKIKKML